MLDDLFVRLRRFAERHQATSSLVRSARRTGSRCLLHVESLESRLLLDAGLLGEYFNEINLTALADTRIDPVINFTQDWGNAPPGTAVTADDNYSERWTGFVHIDQPGNWTFYTTSNDGVRLWVDDSQIIDHWDQHTVTEDSSTVNLDAGWYPIRLEHFQQNGTAEITLSFAGPGQAKAIIPSTHLNTVNPGAGDPVADAGPDKVLLLPDNEVTLNGTGIDDGTIVSYQWIQDSGPTTATLNGQDTPNLTATNLSEGTYSFSLTVTDDDGNTDTDSAVVNVVPLDGGGVVTGELRKWHKVTITFDGPQTSETAATNPFADYRLDVTFTHTGTGKSYLAPGYYAADGNAANTGASNGNKWRVHFAPSEVGEWTWTASFRTGNNVAVSENPNAGTSGGFFDGAAGTLNIADTNKTGRDLRGKGLLQYVGGHYLQFAETGEYFLKQGPDAPENLLAYEDFDNTPNNGGRLKSYAPHAGDWNPGDPSWAGGKGTELIGAVNYLASEGLNAFSFIPMNIGGDDKNVFPYISDNAGDRTRIDVSKVDQWEIVFEHATENGFFLHFKTQETENELLLDGGNLGPQRTVYYRELIARFGHHLALNWNLGEEINNASTAQKQAWAKYFHDNDPYQHHIVIHNGANHYDLLGNNSELTGFSLQTNRADFANVHSRVLDYLTRSANAGKPWAVAVDEPGDAQHALRPDNDAGNSHEDGRKNALWGTLLAGGWGNEWYFGYAHAHSDLTLNDFRSRDDWWDYTRYALEFFNNNNIPFWEMQNDNSISSASNDYGFVKDGEVYVLYLKNGGTTNLDLSGVTGTFTVQWFDPRNGGALQTGTVQQVNGGGSVSVGQAPNSVNQDWTILITRTDAPVLPSVNITASDNSAAEEGLEMGEFTITRTDTTGNLTVNYSIGGNADASDHVESLTGSVTILDGASSATITITPVDDDVFEGNETLQLTLLAGSGYVVGSPAGAVVTIADNDAPTQSPFGGSPRPLADGLRLEAEDFDEGGEGIAYHDTNTANQGGAYRPGEGVDLQGTTDIGGGFNVGWISNGEYLEYTVDVTAGVYDIDARVASQNSNPGDLRLLIGNGPDGAGFVELGTFTVNSTGGWQNWTTASLNDIDLSPYAGPGKVLRLEMVGSNFNINWLEFAEVSTVPQNQPPSVDAGANETITLPVNSVNLNGTVTDDGLPNPPGAVVTTWTKLSGPGNVLFSDANSIDTTAMFDAPGAYTLRLTANDGDRESFDDVVITVHPEPSVTPTITLVDDAYIENSTGFNDAFLKVETAGRVRTSYLKLDVSGLTGHTVTRVTVSLTVASDPGNGTIQALVGVGNDWTESTLSPSNAPTSGAVLDSQTGSFAQGQVVTFDITSAITGDGTYSIILAIEAGGNDVWFSSSEGVAPPQLVIETVPSSEQPGGSDGPPAVEAFVQDTSSSNIVSIEATSFDAHVAQGGHTWTVLSETSATGGNALVAGPNTGTNNNTGYVTNSPRLDFHVNLVAAGIHYVWILGRAQASPSPGNNDSLHVGLDGQATDTSDRISGFGTSYGWSNSTMDGSVATLDVASTGLHTLNIWMREDGFIFDKILITTDPNFTPTGEGPDESNRGSV